MPAYQVDTFELVMVPPILLIINTLDVKLGVWDCITPQYLSCQAFVSGIDLLSLFNTNQSNHATTSLSNRCTQALIAHAGTGRHELLSDKKWKTWLWGPIWSLGCRQYGPHAGFSGCLSKPDVWQYACTLPRHRRKVNVIFHRSLPKTPCYPPVILPREHTRGAFFWMHSWHTAYNRMSKKPIFASYE